MNVSENIKTILQNSTSWKLYRNKSYKAKIQKADKNMVYNVEGRPGIVYNFLEDSYAEVNEHGLVVTGVAGEMWPIGEKALEKYQLTDGQPGFEPIEVQTVETDAVYCGVRIPKEIAFFLETDYGVRTMLRGNRLGIDHGDGDYVLVFAKKEKGRYLPDFSDSGRIVNGSIFDLLYQEFHEEYPKND